MKRGFRDLLNGVSVPINVIHFCRGPSHSSKTYIKPRIFPYQRHKSLMKVYLMCSLMVFSLVEAIPVGSVATTVSKRASIKLASAVSDEIFPTAIVIKNGGFTGVNPGNPNVNRLVKVKTIDNIIMDARHVDRKTGSITSKGLDMLNSPQQTKIGDFDPRLRNPRIEDDVSDDVSQMSFLSDRSHDFDSVENTALPKIVQEEAVDDATARKAAEAMKITFKNSQQKPVNQATMDAIASDRRRDMVMFMAGAISGGTLGAGVAHSATKNRG